MSKICIKSFQVLKFSTFSDEGGCGHRLFGKTIVWTSGLCELFKWKIFCFVQMENLLFFLWVSLSLLPQTKIKEKKIRGPCENSTISVSKGLIPVCSSDKMSVCRQNRHSLSMVGNAHQSLWFFQCNRRAARAIMVYPPSLCTSLNAVPVVFSSWDFGRFWNPKP